MAKEQAGLIRDEDEEENGGGREDDEEGGRRMWKRTQWRRWPQAGEAGGKAGVFPLNSDCMRCMRFNHPLTHSLTHSLTHTLTHSL